MRSGGLALAQEIRLDRDNLKNVGGFADPTSDVRLLTEAYTLDTSNQQVAQAYARMVNNMIDPLPPKPITYWTSLPRACGLTSRRKLSLVLNNG